MVCPKAVSGTGLVSVNSRGRAERFQQWQWWHEEQQCVLIVNNFSLKIRRFLTVREQKFRNISVLEANNLVRKTELNKCPEPYGMVSCWQLKPVVQIFSTPEFLYIDYCHVRCHDRVNMHVCTVISEDVKASYAADYFRKCLCLL